MLTIGQGALARAQKAGNLAVQATVMNNLGAVYVLSGERLKGADFYQQAYKLYQSWTTRLVPPVSRRTGVRC